MSPTPKPTSPTPISWDEYFMGMALLAAKRSKDPHTQVGACIADPDKRIVGLGYNGMPNRCSDHDFPWVQGDPSQNLESKYLYVCHAELNAILNANTASLKGCRLYVPLFPCNECAKAIIQAGISEIIYLSDKYSTTLSVQASKRMFAAAGVSFRPLSTDLTDLSISYRPEDV